MAEAAIAIGLGGLAGAAIGSAFFAGLWLTVKRVAEQGRPRSLLLVSFAVRTILAVGLLALLARQGMLPLLGALGGFLASRGLVTRLVKGSDDQAQPEVENPSSLDAQARPGVDAVVRDGGSR